MKGSSNLFLYIVNYFEINLVYFSDVVWKYFGWIGEMSLESCEVVINNLEEVIKIIKDWWFCVKLFFVLYLDMLVSLKRGYRGCFE